MVFMNISCDYSLKITEWFRKFLARPHVDRLRTNGEGDRLRIKAERIKIVGNLNLLRKLIE